MNNDRLLSFGHSWATHQTNAVELYEKFHLRNRPIHDISFASNTRQSSFSADLKIGDLSLISVTSDPMCITASADAGLSLVLPTHGSGVVNDGKTEFNWTANSNFLRTSHDSPLNFTYQNASFVSIRPNYSNLKNEIQKQQLVTADIDDYLLGTTATVLPSKTGMIDYAGTLLRLLRIVDSSAGNETFLERIGIGTVITKLIAAIIVDHDKSKKQEDQCVRSVRDPNAINAVCDHIKTFIGNPLTDSEMETLSGMTLQKLIVAFRSRFNCSPQEWQRDWLLDEAKKRISSSKPGLTPEVVSYELGFHSFKSFSRHYLNRFGELPSMTALSGKLH